MTGRQVLAVKLQVPRARWTPPQRLLAAARDPRPGSVTVLAAGPGHGRTTLAAAVARASGGTGEAVAWLSVDSFDASPDRLLDHLAVAVGRTDTVDDGPAGAHVARLDAILSAWTDRPGLMLVLDDVSDAGSAASAALLSYLLAHAPGPALVTMSTTPHGARGRVVLPAGSTTLRSHELSFTPDETREALIHGGIRADDPDLAALAHDTGGFPAIIGGVTARGSASASAARAWLVVDGVDQVVGPWWDSLDDDARELLVATTALERLHPALCEIALGSRAAGHRFEALASEQPFLRADASGDVRTWSRHPLLSRFLRDRAPVDALPPERYRRMAEWYRAHRDVDGEIRARVRAGDDERARDLIAEHENDMILDERWPEVLAWYDLLHPDDQRAAPEMLLRRAWGAAVRFQLADARLFLARLRALLPEDPGAAALDRDIHGETAALAAHLAITDGDPRAALEECARADAAFRGAWSTTGHQVVPVLRGRALLCLGQTARAAEAARTYERVPASHEIFEEVLAPGLVAAVAVAEGRPRLAWSTADAALTAATVRPTAGLEQGRVQLLVARGLAAVDLARADEARRDLSDGLTRARGHGSLPEEVGALVGLIRLEALLGTPREGLERSAEAREVVTRRNPDSPLLHTITAAEALTRLRLGDAARAQRLLAVLPASPSRTLLEIRLAQLRRAGSGLSVLERWSPSEPRDAVDRLVLLANAVARSNRARAGELLSTVAALGTDLGLMCALVGADDVTLDIAHERAARTADDALSTLLGIAVPPPEGRPGALPHLSSGERELLALLPTRDSNEAIAQRLSVSVNTVKTRLQRLYRKLDVRSRDEAVRVARERSLIR